MLVLETYFVLLNLDICYLKKKHICTKSEKQYLIKKKKKKKPNFKIYNKTGIIKNNMKMSFTIIPF